MLERARGRALRQEEQGSSLWPLVRFRFHRSRRWTRFFVRVQLHRSCRRARRRIPRGRDVSSRGLRQFLSSTGQARGCTWFRLHYGLLPLLTGLSSALAFLRLRRLLLLIIWQHGQKSLWRAEDQCRRVYMSTYRLPAHCAAVYRVQSSRKHVGRRTKGRQRFATIGCVFYTSPLCAVSTAQRATIVAGIGLRTFGARRRIRSDNDDNSRAWRCQSVAESLCLPEFSPGQQLVPPAEPCGSNICRWWA